MKLSRWIRLGDERAEVGDRCHAGREGVGSSDDGDVDKNRRDDGGEIETKPYIIKLVGKAG